MTHHQFTFQSLAALTGQRVGSSSWITLDQTRINQFAEATGDHQWIHVDVERAKKDMPGGKTIAHGFLTLSLIPMLNHQISHINNVRNGINYGCNKVRFTSPVPAGSRVRVRANASPRGASFIWPWAGDDAVGFAKFTFMR